MTEMATGSRQLRRSLPTLAVLGVVGVTLALLVVPTYIVGKNSEDSRQFLRNYRPPNDYEVGVSVQMDYVLNSSEHNDILFLGDSTCIASIRPTQFEQSTGLKAYNLGFPGVIEMRGFIMVLQSYLERHSKPRLLVVVIHPWSLDKLGPDLGPVEIRDRFFRCYGSGKEDMRPPHDNPRDDYIRQGFWTLLGKSTGGIEQRLTETIQGQFGEDTYNARQRQFSQQRGFWEFPPAVMAGNHRPRGTPDAPFAVIPDYKDGFRNLARICTENGIMLLIRLSPVFEGDAPTNSDALLEWSKELKSEYPQVIFGRPEVVLFELAYFWDKLHCNGKGADKFTALLIDDVNKALSK